MLGEPIGQGWQQILELAIALVLSALIGLERELRHKSAGLRTHTLIGFSAALMMLVSKYGFTDVLGAQVVLDPSRVAAQIVSGIGFIGGGLIFVRRDAVRGLTTAAAVWLTTAVGMAAGAGLPVLAIATAVGYFAVVYGFTPLAGRLQRSQHRTLLIQIVYQDGRGVLRQIMNICTASGWAVAELSSHQHTPLLSSSGTRQPGWNDSRPVSVTVSLQGPTGDDNLVPRLSGLDGVITVIPGQPNPDADPDAERQFPGTP